MYESRDLSVNTFQGLHRYGLHKPNNNFQFQKDNQKNFQCNILCES